MASDGITILEVEWIDCFGLYGPGSFHLTMTSGPVAEQGGAQRGRTIRPSYKSVVS